MKLSEDKETIIFEFDVKSLLGTIPDWEIHSYAKKHLDMIDENDADDYCDCESNELRDFHDFEIIDELTSRGYTVLNVNAANQSIVRESAIERLVDLLSKKTDFEVSQIVDKLM